jgi:hypothetical protein
MEDQPAGAQVYGYSLKEPDVKIKLIMPLAKPYPGQARTNQGYRGIKV